jgi:hypothetical protein
MAGAIDKESKMKFIVCAATAVFLLWATPALAGPCVDADVDGICDTSDNCVHPAPGTGSSFNPGQDDTDGDMCGNVCDPDFPVSGNPGNGETNVFDVLDMLPLGLIDPLHDVTDPVGSSVVNVFDVLQLLNWLNGPPIASPAGPSGTTLGSIFCPV